MKTTPTLHNDLFIDSMKDKKTAINFLRRFLPADFLKLVDLDTLEIEATNFYGEGLHADVIYRLNIAGAPAFILVILEHQSTADKWMPLRMFKYKLAAAEQIRASTNSKHLPVIYSMCFYHDSENKLYPYSTDFYDLFGEHSDLAKELFFKPFDLIDVNQLNDRELLTLKEFGLMAYALKYGRSKDEILPYFDELISELAKLDKSKDDRQYSIKLIEYILKVSKTEHRQDIYDRVRNNLSTETIEGVMSIAGDIFKDGEHNASVKIFVEQLEHKFGSLSSEQIKQLEKLVDDDTTGLSNRIIDAESIDEVFPKH